MARASRPAAPSSLTVIAFLLMMAYIASLTAAAVERNSIFHDPLSLWFAAVKQSPNKKRTHENYGQALSSAGKLNEALKQLQTVLSLPDRDTSVPFRDVYRELGVVYYRLGRIDESIAAWKKGLAYAPMDAGLLNNIAIALMRQHHLDEALASALAAIRSNPYMPEPLNTAGEVYLAMGQPAKAAENFMQYVQFRPEDRRGYWNAALALEKAGDYQRSARYVSMFLSMGPDPGYRQAAQSLLRSLQSRIGTASGAARN
jgi:tetratricopeptide (TPR) repeat protein